MFFCKWLYVVLLSSYVILLCLSRVCLFLILSSQCPCITLCKMYSVHYCLFGFFLLQEDHNGNKFVLFVLSSANFIYYYYVLCFFVTSALYVCYKCVLSVS